MVFRIMRIDQHFTRQEMALLTGIADDVLAFWIKNDLLVATQGGSGKGSHRKFTGYQVNIAGVLAELRNNGINIAGLRAFAAQLQRGTQICVNASCNFASLYDAMELRSKFEAFRGHEPVIVGIVNGVQSLATSVEEIVQDFFFDPRHRKDTLLNIATFANQISGADFGSIRLFQSLNACGFDDNRDEEWLAIRVSEEEWQIHTTMQAGRSAAFEQGSNRSALYLWVGNIVADIWGSRLERITFEDLPFTQEDQARLRVLEERWARANEKGRTTNAYNLQRAAAAAAKEAGA